MVSNSAIQGGGIAASGLEAILRIKFGCSLLMKKNYAQLDGGGVALSSGAALFEVLKMCPDSCLPAMRGNDKCDPECSSVECDW